MGTIIIVFIVLLIEFFLIESLPAPRKQKNNLAYIVLFTQLFILYGWRGDGVVPDTFAYSLHFKNIHLNEYFYQINFSDEIWEPGYLIFEKFIHNVITDSTLHYQIITSFIILSTTFYFFRKYSHYAWLTLFLFFSLRLCQSELIALRQTLALVFGFFAYYSLQQKKNIWYFLFVLIAIAFHRSAWMLLVFFLVEHIKLHKKNFIIAISSFILIFVFYGYILTNYVNTESSKYFEHSIENMSTTYGVFNSINAVMLFLIILYLNTKSDFIGKSDKKHTFLALLYVATAVISIRLWITERFLIYLLPFVIVYISNLVYYIPNKLLKHFIIFVLVSYSIATFLFLFSIRPEWIGMIPYKFYGQ